MATELEIRNACKLVDDNVDLAEVLETLTSIFSGVDGIEIIIARGDEQFSINRLKSKLESQGDDFDGMIGAFETAILGVVGASDASIGTLRKAVADLIAANDVTVAGT